MVWCGVVLLEEPLGEDATAAIVKVKHMYHSCLNISVYQICSSLYILDSFAHTHVASVNRPACLSLRCNLLINHTAE